MKFCLIVLVVCCWELSYAKLPTKKLPKINPQSAIIAIQIIDPNENKTSTKNSKRTIESSLGYGYQGHQSPRYEIYKYSQHDIPPYNGPPLQQFTSNTPQHNYNNAAPASKQVSNFYQPGTVLFSTINQRGKLGQLSQQFPVSLTNHQFPIPVIILRVHPSQLSSPVYPNLPQNHFLASAINSIDINSLLSNHINTANAVKQPPEQYLPQYEQPQSDQGYVQPQGHQSEQYEEPTSYQTQEYYPQYQYEDVQSVQNYVPQQVEQQHVVPAYTAANYPQPGHLNDFNTPELLTHENYPSEKHTQIVFKRAKKAKLATVSKKSQPPHPVESPKVPIIPHQTADDPEQDPDPKEKYQAPPMYYTVQYSDDQQYVYRQDPQYDERSQDLYSKGPETQDYVYVTRSQPVKH